MSSETKIRKRAAISDKVWLLISLLVALAVWYLLSIGEKTGRGFPFAPEVLMGLRGLIQHVGCLLFP